MFVDYRDPEAIEQHGTTADFVLDASLFNAGEHAALTLAKKMRPMLAWRLYQTIHTSQM